MANSALRSAMKDHPLQAKQMIENGDVDINQVFENEPFKNCSPLQYATHLGNVHLVQLLLEHGADASPKHAMYEPLLYLACSRRGNNKYELCKLLLEKGADCNAPVHGGPLTPFLIAVEDESLELVKLFLNFGANIEAIDRNGNTVLHYAALNQQVDVIAFMLNQGLNIESRNQSYDTPLFHAIRNQNWKVFEFLLNHGANVNIRNGKSNVPSLPTFLLKFHFGWNPRVIAVVLDILLAHGAIVDQEFMAVTVKCSQNDITNVLLRYLAKMEYRTLTIDEDIRSTIETCDYSKLYYWRCWLELDTMKRTKIHNSVSMFCVLMGSKNQISQCASNEFVVKALEEKDYSLMFPIYFTWLKKKFYVEVERRRLCKNAAEILSNLFMVNDPAHLVLHNILSYHSNADLKYLCSDFTANPSIFDELPKALPNVSPFHRNLAHYVSCSDDHELP